MQTTGKIIEKLLEVTGENENGNWIRGGFALLTADDRGDTLSFEVSGTDRCNLVRQLNVGETIVVTWRPSSRKFQDKWFTSLKAYDIMRLQKREEK